MDFNPGKCQVLISCSRDPIKHSYTHHGQVFQAVDHAKYLGLEISSNLTWNTHIQNMTTKANRTLGFIWRNICTKQRHMRDCLQHFGQTPSRVCFSWVEPIYPVQHKVEKIQRRATRWSKMTTPHIIVWPRCSVPLVGDLWNRGISYCSTRQFMALTRYDCPHISTIQLEPLKPCIPCTSFKFPPLPVTTNTVSSPWLLYSGIIFLLKLLYALIRVPLDQSYAPSNIQCHRPWNTVFTSF